jgi:hypothetical protein
MDDEVTRLFAVLACYAEHVVAVHTIVARVVGAAMVLFSVVYSASR